LRHGIGYLEIEMNELELLKKVHDELLEASSKLSFDKTHPWHRNLIALHGSMIELIGNILILLNGGGTLGVPSIFRTILEAFVEFKNLLEDRTYGYNMEAQFSLHKLRQYEEAEKGNNPYLDYYSELPDLLELISNEKKALGDLKSKGYVPLKVLERFEKAGMINEYRSIYGSLSSDAHGNISVLIDRHCDIKGDDFDMVYYEDRPISKYHAEIFSACNMLIQSAIGIHELLESDAVTEIIKLQKEFEDRQRTIIEEQYRD
jgi:hypothetical protein